MREAKGGAQDLSRQMTETGASADRMRQRLEAATKALPKIKIDADSTAAEIKFAELRSQMDSLSDKRIGIDISAADAMAQIQEIERELEKLERAETDINVKADIGSALAELRAVDAEVSKLNGKDARVDVNADVAGALRSIALVGAALASLPAVTTIAVGVTALGGAFAAAGAGAAAFGAVAIPALGRINDALKAQETAAKSAGTATGGAGQSAAQAAQQAMQLEQAERRLKDAQAEERAAQEDLTRAREAGRRALEDMNFSLERSILSQKDAALAVREAEARLSELQGDPKATALEIERAQLSLEMAQQRAREQEVKTQRARKDTTEANREGVKGTKEYQDALERLKDAQAKTEQAAQQLKIAHLQQQQAMSGGGGGAAKARDAFADLNKEEIALAKNIKSFKDEYIKWQRALEPDVFPVIDQGLRLMRVGLEEATPLAKSASAGLLTFGKNAETALTGPFWQQFLTNINTQIPGAMTGLGNSFINVSTGVAGVIDAFLPFTPTIVGGVEKASLAFSKWGQNLKNSPEFHEFILFVKENAPEVLELAKNLAETLGKIGEAVGPLGVGAFSGLGLLAKLTAGMDPEHIRLIAVAIVAIKTAQAGLGVARFFTEIPSKIGAVRDGFDKVTTATGKFGDALGGLKDKVGNASTLLGGAVLTGGLLLLEDRLNKNAVAAGRFAEKIQALAGSDVDSQIRAMTEQVNKLKEATGPSLDLGVVNLAPFAWDNELDKIDALEEKIAQLKHQKELDAIASKTAQQGISGLGNTATTAAGQIGGLTSKMGMFNSAAGSADQAAIGFKGTVDRLAVSLRENGRSFDLNSEKGRANRTALIEAAQAAADHAAKVYEQTQDVGKANTVLNTHASELRGVMRDAGLSESAIDKLIKKYLVLPKSASTDVAAKGAEKSIREAERLGKLLDGLDGKTVTATVIADIVERKRQIAKQDNLKARAGGIVAYAEGGVERYAVGGVRSTAPNIASGPTILYGEGADQEAFIPYEQRYRSRAIDLLSKVANDFGLQLNNQQAARSLSDLSVTIDGSGMQVAGGLQAVMGSLQSTMGQAGSLTSSIGKVGASAAQLDQSWLAGSRIIGDTVDLLGSGVDGLSGAVKGLSAAVAAAQAATGKKGADEPGMIAGSGPKPKGKAKPKPGFVEGNQPLKPKPPGGLVEGSQPLDQGYAYSGASALSSGPINSSRVSAPQQVRYSGSPSSGGGAAAGGAAGTGLGGTVVNKTLNINGTTIRETVDAQVMFTQASQYLDSRG
jgi:hypothetical protein